MPLTIWYRRCKSTKEAKKKKAKQWKSKGEEYFMSQQERERKQKTKEKAKESAKVFLVPKEKTRPKKATQKRVAESVDLENLKKKAKKL
ncbi:hypothetical protein QR680_010206 [Steinernema hermaphroditum]|uniref:Uncharacterized protein n=1 Tax=Steinernema hermaphroditum TaxID=289476 RepID=A0AA39IQL4_9BILA|nr:hypothetical protein QR680_010206 [Steinernema hermaphroditum]